VKTLRCGWWLPGLVVVALLGGLALPGRAAEPGRHGAESAYVRELLKILEDTGSADAFLIALDLLVDTDVEPCTAVPLVLRHAERLGILAGALKTDDKEPESLALVAEAVRKLHDRRHPSGGAEEQAREAACTPTPVVPWAAGRGDDRRTPVPPPVRAEPPPGCNDPPDEADVLRALRPPAGSSPLCESTRDNVQVVTELLVDRIDPPRFYPLVGTAQLHHCHWKCTVYYTETVRFLCPFPGQLRSVRSQVVYLDKDHLHRMDPGKSH
jgi:hypothetical protein